MATTGILKAIQGLLGFALAVGFAVSPLALAAGRGGDASSDKPALAFKGCVQEALALPQKSGRAMESVVVIQNQGQIGSGVLVSPEGYILTAAHVVGDAQTVAVFLKSGDSVPGRVLRADPVQDIALVKIDKIGDGSYPCLPVQRKAPVIGSRIFGFGASPRGDLSLTMAPAWVDGYRAGQEGPAYIQVEADWAPGYSGGPLLNSQGQVVGIISWKMAIRYADTLSFGSPVDRLEQTMRFTWL